MGTLTGKSIEYVNIMKRRKVNVACLQETNWKVDKAKEHADAHKHYYVKTDKSMKLNFICIISFRFMDLYKLISFNCIEFHKEKKNAFKHPKWNSCQNQSEFIKLHCFIEIILFGLSYYRIEQLLIHT